jgi:hypothetical protein
MNEPYVEELSDHKCPLCGRFYSLGEAEVIEALKERNEERWPCCFRCVLASPDLKIGVVESHSKEKLDSMLMKYDEDYEKALERKFSKNFIR